MVMAEASCWRYLRVPVGQSRIMQLDGKSGEPGGWEDGFWGDEKPTLLDAEAERVASRSEGVDGVGGNEIGYASIDEEAGVINKSGNSPSR